MPVSGCKSTTMIWCLLYIVSETTVAGPTTTTKPPQPCQANFAVIVDGSTGLTPDQYARQTWWIGTWLFYEYWTYSQWAIGQMSSTLTVNFPFRSLPTREDAQQAIQHVFQTGRKASLARYAQCFSLASPSNNRTTLSHLAHYSALSRTLKLPTHGLAIHKRQSCSPRQGLHILLNGAYRQCSYCAPYK